MARVICGLLLLTILLSGSLEVREYAIHTDTISVDGSLNSPVLHSTQATFEPFNSVSHTLLLQYRVEILLEHNSNGYRTFGLFIDGQEISNCRFSVETVNAGGLTNRIISLNLPSVGCFADIEFVNQESHSHNVSIEEVANTGTLGTIHSWNSNIVIYSQEVYEMNPATAFEELTGLTALEFAIFPALAFVGTMLWLRASDGVVRSFGSVLVMLSGALLILFAVQAGIGSVWSGTIPFGATLILMGGYLQFRYFIERLGGDVR